MDSQTNPASPINPHDSNLQESIPAKKSLNILRIIVIIGIIIVILGMGIFELYFGKSKSNGKSQIKPQIISNNIKLENVPLTPPIGKLYCQNEQLGILIEYPDYMICDQKNDIRLKRKTEKSVVAPEIIIRPIDNLYNKFDTFEKNIIQAASELCSGNGPMKIDDGTVVMGELNCPVKYITLQKFTNKNNIVGYNIQRKVIAEAEGKVQWVRQEIITFYKLDTHDNFAIMISTDSHNTSQEVPNNLNKELSEISLSFRYIKTNK
jgi:hypothetical protein